MSNEPKKSLPINERISKEPTSPSPGIPPPRRRSTVNSGPRRGKSSTVLVDPASMHRIAGDSVSLLTKIVLLLGVAGAAAGQKAARDLTEANLEQLMNIQVTSVSKKAWGL